ncbi:MAG: colanic acid biosynthesis acetyltransferase WcaF, partial [Fimbriimonadaceae bacterium]
MNQQNLPPHEPQPIDWGTPMLIKRGIWEAFLLPLVKHLPRPFNGFRNFVLKAMGAKIGRDVVIMSGCRILMPWNLEIGDNTMIGRNVDVYNYGKIKIGRDTTVSQYTYLCTGTHDPADPHFKLIWFPITVGDRVWV